MPQGELLKLYGLGRGSAVTLGTAIVPAKSADERPADA
jgi:hypothetical protein